MRAPTRTTSELGEVTEAAARFFERFLWESPSCEGIRVAMERRGVGEATLRSFRVGYAPIGPNELLDHLASVGFDERDACEAGLASTSATGRAHARFRSRVMFPVLDSEGRAIGFAGMATHLGPSWPLWLNSLDVGSYRRSDAVYGLPQAARAIAKAGRATLADDSLAVLAAHERGETTTVAVHSSRVTPAQIEALAAGLPGGSEDLELDTPSEMRLQGPGVGRTPLRSSPGRVVEEERAGLPAVVGVSGERLEPPEGGRARLFVPFAALAIGIAVPVAWLLITDPAQRPKGGTSEGLPYTLIGIGATYIVLTLLVAFASGRAKRRSTARRMRLPWLIGLTEWQPTAWTYHQFERILVGAAVTTTVICLIILSTLGGFFG